jgi:hypothetical protein
MNFSHQHNQRPVSFRFNGDEVLRCFCGSTSCRGVVNHDENNDEDYFLKLARSEVEVISWKEAEAELQGTVE